MTVSCLQSQLKLKHNINILQKQIFTCHKNSNNIHSTFLIIMYKYRVSHKIGFFFYTVSGEGGAAYLLLYSYLGLQSLSCMDWRTVIPTQVIIICVVGLNFKAEILCVTNEMLPPWERVNKWQRYATFTYLPLASISSCCLSAEASSPGIWYVYSTWWWNGLPWCRMEWGSDQVWQHWAYMQQGV